MRTIFAFTLALVMMFSMTAFAAENKSGDEMKIKLDNAGYTNEGAMPRGPAPAVSKADVNQNNFNLKIGGLASRALQDGTNVTVYKADSYTKEYPLLRVVTTSANGHEQEQFIDPKNVDLENATENEIFAFHSYMVDQGKLDCGIYCTSILQDTGVSDSKKNFLDIVRQSMEMQYQAKNLSGYAAYSKILAAYQSYMNE